MQCSIPVCGTIAMMISLTQTNALPVIIKDYITIAFIMDIDSIIGLQITPMDVLQNGRVINKKGLELGKDFN